MSFTKVQIIHMVVEAILIVGLTAFVVVKSNQQSAKINELENELRMQKSRTDVLEAVVQEILRGQNQTIRQRVSQVVKNVRPQGGQIPIQVQARPVQQQAVQQQQAPPPPPRANPIESMMAMMAPMMSSLVIGGDDEPESHVEIEEEQVDDSEIAEELNELKKDSGDDIAVVEEVVEDEKPHEKVEDVGTAIDNEIEEEIAALEENEEDK